MSADDNDQFTLSHLALPRDQILALTPPSDNRLLALVDELHETWTDSSIELDDLLSFARNIYGLTGSDFGLKDLEYAARIKKYQYKNLLNLLHERKMFEDDGELIDKVTSISQVMGATYQTMFNAFVMYNRLDGSRGNKIPPAVVDEETFEDHDPLKLTSFQSLLIHLLKRIYIKRLHKSGDGCYEEILSPDGYRTHAFRFVCTIEAEVWSVQKEVSFSLWKNFTNPRDNPRMVIDHLQRSHQSEFPEIDVGKGEYFAFQNGLYNIRYDLFFNYEASYEKYAKAMQMARKLVANPCSWYSKRVESLPEICEQFRDANLEKALTDLISNGTPIPTNVLGNRSSELCVHHYVIVNGQAMMPEHPMEPYPVPSDRDVAINYFAIPFRNPPTPRNPHFDASKCITPGFETVFNTQCFNTDTKKWAYIMIGRLFFRLKTLENWQRVLFMIGGGGTGKTTISVWLKYVFKHFYSLINSNFEEQFGLGPLCQDRFRLCMCTEMGEDIKFKQEEFQVCAEAGEVQAAIKGKDSFPYEWKQPMAFCGNQFPRKWKNNGKQISRRVFLLHFEKLVDKEKIDTSMPQQLEAETDLLIRKCTTMYVDMALRHPKEDIEAPGLMPDQVREFMKAFENAMDPLTGFIESGHFARGRNCRMPEEDFKQAYKEFRLNNGFPTVPWTSDHYQSTFQQYKLFMQYGSHPWPTPSDEPKSTNWVLGIMPISEEEMVRRKQQEIELQNAGNEVVDDDESMLGMS